MNNRRIVITGIGVVSSIGIGRDDFLKGMTEGKSGVTEITSLDTSKVNCHYGGEVKDFNPENFISKRKINFLGRTSQLAIAASSQALEDAKLSYKEIPEKKFGVIIGTTLGEKPIEELTESWAKGGLKDVHREKILQASVNNISANVGVQFKAKGPNFLIPTACAAGNYAVGYGFDLIKKGELNFVLAGGAESFSRTAFFGFQRLNAMSQDKCMPFDKNRKGLILGEGAGILLLESLESAIKRGADIYAEILGYGASCDAYHPTAPDPSGVVKAMEKALKESKISYKEVDYISAHGTGTPMNDKVECFAIKDVFKERYKEVPVSSLKSMIGHTLGAASAIESIACCLAIKNSILPPTINYETPDSDCDIDCVPNIARQQKIKTVLNNAFAFGGNNCCVVFRDVDNKG